MLLRRRKEERKKERNSGEPAAPPPTVPATRSENRDMSEIDTLQQQRLRGTLIPNVGQYKYSGNLFIIEAGTKI